MHPAESHSPQGRSAHLDLGLLVLSASASWKIMSSPPTSRDFPDMLAAFAEQLGHRSMVVKKAKPLPVECVVRGYLAGSGWKEYQASQRICGIQLPAGLRQAEQLPETIFTPSTKAESGHDMNIPWDECRRLVGDDVAEQVRTLSIRIYEEGRAYAAEISVSRYNFSVRYLPDLRYAFSRWGRMHGFLRTFWS
ncbi:MAG: phosphoribosylaminoimidazolesuccinocarboxamide synthase [Pirellulales bacterium]